MNHTSILAVFSFIFLALLTILTEISSPFLSVFNTTVAHSFALPQLTDTARILTVVGEVHILIPLIGGIIFLLLLKRRHSHAFRIFLISLAVVLSVIVLKVLTAIPRPDTALLSLDSFSFPSGHAAFSLLVSFIIIDLLYTYTKKKAVTVLSSVALLLIALSVGLSRLLLEVHTASDILAGFMIALFWYSLILSLGTQKIETGE